MEYGLNGSHQQALPKFLDRSCEVGPWPVSEPKHALEMSMPTLFRCIGAPLFGIGKDTLAYRPPSLHSGALLSKNQIIMTGVVGWFHFLSTRNKGSVYPPILDRALCR